MGESGQGLLEVGGGLAIGRACERSLPSEPEIGDGLGPDRATHGVPGQAFRFFFKAGRVGRLNDAHDQRMKLSPSNWAQTFVGNLVGQGMLEAVDHFWSRDLFVEEFSPH